MKRYFIFILFLLIPFHVFAEDNVTCEPINTHDEKTIDIKITQTVKNKENIRDEDLSKFKFHYKILDLDDTVLAETINDDDGNVIFHCFDVKSSDIGQYKLYKIVMEENEDSPFTSDPYIIYFSLRPKYTNELFDPIIAFYKDDGDDSPERYNTTYKGKVFHATEEELEGQAYAVIDKDTGIMTFFRDEPNKYTNKQAMENKIYYTGFEEYSQNSSWRDGWFLQSEIINTVKKVVFQDAIKPKSVFAWFERFINLEEVDISKLDTSLITNMNWFFYECRKLKSIDISTMDISNIRLFQYAFSNTKIEYFDLSVWDLSADFSRGIFSEGFSRNPNLKYINISNFGDWAGSADFYDIPCLEKIVVNGDYGFQSTALDQSVNYPIWYSPIKKMMYSSISFKKNNSNYAGDMTGYYIRPMCTSEASFVSTYNPSEEPSIEIPVPDTAMNKTAGLIIGGFLVVIIGFMVVSYVAKSKENID